jgi:ubiquinone/menaquinone biosynthesis C-methylase UbiE
MSPRQEAQPEFGPESAGYMARVSWEGRQSFIHPRLAKQVLHDFGITEGRALDIGCGAARLTVELARRSRLALTGLDISPHMLDIARMKVKEHGLEDRITLVEAKAEKLPFPDNHFQLIVSRGAIGFFENKTAAFREIHRVLAPGGHTWVGGGDARGWPANPRDFFLKITFQYDAWRRFRRPQWKKMWLSQAQWEDILREAGVNDYTIHPGRMWIEIRKRTG